ncbi:MAG TPA: hypothetical protein VLY24_12945 [Bryobacteraceae bacterium]|nr:hypothetical protein [Bryobacteraceae bacterium]
MFGIDWNNPQTLWLNMTNLALGVVTLLALLFVGGAVGWEFILRRRRARELSGIDAELHTMIHADSPYSLPVPGLGLTMADGGEAVKPLPAAAPQDNQKRT